MANVCATGYEGDYFDAVVCIGSFYLWDRPEQGLEEINRILKLDCSAHLFETNRGYDRIAYKGSIEGEPEAGRIGDAAVWTTFAGQSAANGI
jgi:ubiquinone/menaquinone biosynthesis C-methylase UbiE